MRRLAASFLLCTFMAVEGTNHFSFKVSSNQQGHDRRRLQSPEDDGNPYAAIGMHFVELYFGNPAQLRTLAVSTTGDFVAMPCEDCISCGPRQRDLYNFTKSSGFNRVGCSACSPKASCFSGRCAFGSTIRDSSSWTGYEVQDLVFQGNGGSDLVSLEGSNAAAKYGFDLRFVCQTSTRGYFNNVINGVLGVSPSPSSFLSQMHASGKLEHPRFSLCFNDVDKGSNDESGLVTFGGFIQSPNTVMVYAKKLNGPAYRVNIKNIHIREGGGKFTRVDKHQRIVIAQLPDGVDTSAKVDSAEPFLTFDKRLEPAFRAAWKEITGEEYSQARQSLTKEEIKMMPTLLIELEGDPDSLHELDPTTVPSLTSNYNVLVAVPAIRYMELTTAEVRPYRPRIQFEGEKGSFLGTNMMQGHTISFEPDVNRIGFAESLDCEPGKGGRSIDDDQVVQVGAMHENLPASTGEASTKMSSAAAAVSPGVLDIGEDEEYAAGDASNKGKTTEENFGGGGCFTATCRSFMALGYIFIGTALAVAYRASRAKERTADDFESSLFEDGPIRKNDDLYRRKGSWNEPPPTSAFV